MEGYVTVLQQREKPEDMVRVMALIREDTSKEVKVREDLMSEKFPSIWIEAEKGLLVCGFYREWTRNGIKSEEEQLRNLETLKGQMERATEERKEIIMMGDGNICANKWNDPQYKNHRVASELKSRLEENGLRSI